ncbi:MAG: M56 family metallopeptidase [Deltaproteobacteria bacterium]
MPVILPIASAFGVVCAAALWLSYGLPGLVAFSVSALALCRDIFIFCGGYLETAKLVFIWTGSSVASAGVLYGLGKTIKNAVSSDMAIRRLPLYHRGGSVVMILDPKIKTAFTHGLLRPRIYISKGLIDSLERPELKAVILHELCHKRRFDPLRFLLYSMIADTFFYIPMLKELAGRFRIKKEAEADRAACRDLPERLTLAGAIVKAASFNLKGLSSMPMPSITGGGETRARVESLINAKKLHFKPIGNVRLAFSLIGAAFVAASVSLPLLPGAAGASQACTTEQCSTHIEKLGEACRTHCTISSATHRH